MTVVFTEVYFKALGLALNFVGAAVLIIGTIRSNRQIEKETTMIPIKKTVAIKRSLFRTRSISLIGLVLISIGFLLQIIGLFVEIYS